MYSVKEDRFDAAICKYQKRTNMFSEDTYPGQPLGKPSPSPLSLPIAPAKEMGARAGSLQMIEEIVWARPQNCGHTGRQIPRLWKICVLPLMCFALVIVIIISVTAIISSGSCPAAVVLSCPSGWVGYEGRCYYFSKSEGTWSSSQINCSASGASLVVIENQKEMDFIMQIKEPTEYWIGLKRNERQPWEWADGTVFSNWFQISADGFCAYLDDEMASSTLCGTRQNWICSKSQTA